MLIISLATVLKIPHECEWNIFVLFHESHKINWYVSRNTLIRLQSFVIIDHSYICQKLSKSLSCITNKVTHIFPNSEFLFVLVRSTLLCFMHWLFEIISFQYDSIDSDDTPGWWTKKNYGRLVSDSGLKAAGNKRSDIHARWVEMRTNFLVTEK